MQIDLYIDGKKKTFTAAIVPMLAKRKWLEIEAKTEEKEKDDENYTPSPKEQLEEENELLNILCEVIFKNQFTLDELVAGAEDEYVYYKLREAVFGKPKHDKSEDNEGNEVGE